MKDNASSWTEGFQVMGLKLALILFGSTLYEK